MELGVLGLLGILCTSAGALTGVITGFDIPSDFEEPITIGVNEWKIVN